MMRIIRVNGCHDCPWKYENWEQKGTQWRHYTGHICYKGKFDINKYIDSETLPDNCPLEEETNK